MRDRTYEERFGLRSTKKFRRWSSKLAPLHPAGLELLNKALLKAQPGKVLVESAGVLE
jgi:hypothetical protein